MMKAAPRNVLPAMLALAIWQEGARAESVPYEVFAIKAEYRQVYEALVRKHIFTGHVDVVVMDPARASEAAMPSILSVAPANKMKQALAVLPKDSLEALKAGKAPFQFFFAPAEGVEGFFDVRIAGNVATPVNDGGTFRTIEREVWLLVDLPDKKRPDGYQVFLVKPDWARLQPAKPAPGPKSP